jgi:hypothetical protein
MELAPLADVPQCPDDTLAQFDLVEFRPIFSCYSLGVFSHA